MVGHRTGNQVVGWITQLEGRSVDRSRIHRLAEAGQDIRPGIDSGSACSRNCPQEFRRDCVRLISRSIAARCGGGKRILHTLDVLGRVADRAAVSREAGQGSRLRMHRDHHLQAIGASSRIDRKAQRPAIPCHVGKGGVIAAIEPRQHLASRHNGHPARLARCHHRAGFARGSHVRVRVDGERTIIALGTERSVQQRIDRVWIGLARLICHLRSRLVDVDQGTVQIYKAHRHAGAGEEARPVGNPTGRPVIVVGVQADAVIERYPGLSAPVAPHDAVGPVGLGRRQAGILGAPRCQLAAVGRRQGSRGPILARGAHVKSDLETLRSISRGLCVGQRCARIDIRGAPNALPVVHVAPCGAACEELVEPSRGAVVAVVIASHHHDGLETAREIPEARQRLLAQVHARNQIGQQPHLLIGLRNGDLVQIHPIPLRVPSRGAEIQVVRANRCETVALLAAPRRITLSCIRHRPGQIECEGSRLAACAPDAGQRDRRMRCDCASAAVQRGE